MSTNTSSARITLLAILANARDQQACAPPGGKPCTDPKCNRLHLVCEGSHIWSDVPREKFNMPDQKRVCARHFASVHPFAYKSSSLKNTTCNGCDNVHVRPSTDISGCFETVAKKVSQGFTLEPM